MIDASLPTPAAAPVPVPRSDVGYSSGPMAYSAPHAPRLKNDRAHPAAMIVPSVPATAKPSAERADPARNSARVRRRPMTSINQAATAYPGSWATVMIKVNSKDLTRVKPCFTSSDGIQMKAP